MLQLDKTRLDQFFEEYPVAFDEVSNALAEAQARVDKLKDELRQLEAQLALTFREELVREGQRVTEKLVEDLIVVDQDWQRKREELLKAQAELNRLKNLRETLREMAAAATELSRLFAAGYWSLSSAERAARTTQVNSVRGR